MAHTVKHDYGKAPGSSENIKVYVRARPPAEKSESDFLLIDDDDKRKLTIKDPKGIKMAKHSEVSFQFDHIFWTSSRIHSIDGTNNSLLCFWEIDRN